MIYIRYCNSWEDFNNPSYYLHSKDSDGNWLSDEELNKHLDSYGVPSGIALPFSALYLSYPRGIRKMECRLWDEAPSFIRNIYSLAKPLLAYYVGESNEMSRCLTMDEFLSESPWKSLYSPYCSHCLFTGEVVGKDGRVYGCPGCNY